MNNDRRMSEITARWAGATLGIGLATLLSIILGDPDQLLIVIAAFVFTICLLCTMYAVRWD